MVYMEDLWQEGTMGRLAVIVGKLSHRLKKRVRIKWDMSLTIQQQKEQFEVPGLHRKQTCVYLCLCCIVTYDAIKNYKNFIILFLIVANWPLPAYPAPLPVRRWLVLTY